MICAKCVPPAVPAGPAPAVTTSPAGGGAGTLLGFLGLAAAGVALYLVTQTQAQLSAQPNLEPRLRTLEQICNPLLEDVASLRERVDGIRSTLDQLGKEPALLRESIGEVQRRVDATERTLASAQGQLDQVRAGCEKEAQLDVRQGQFEGELRQLRDAVSVLSIRVAELAATPAAPTAADPNAPPAKEAGPVFVAETKKLIADLASKDASTRWTAVERLKALHDANLVPYLIPLLEDDDAFVQFNVVGAVRELNARGAVARLIKILRDSDSIVRGEALDALISLTGNTLRFAVDGKPDEREKGVKAWEEWYGKNKERFPETPPPAPAGP